MQQKRCLTCGKELTGRIDKKFCDDQCRSTYNNRKKGKKEKMIMAVNRQLRKNRSILKTLCPLGKATVRKDALEALDFAFQYFTSVYKSNNTTYYFCYEFGYAPILERSSETGEAIKKVLIIQHQQFMKGSFDPWNHE